MSRFLKKKPTPKIDRVTNRGREMLGKAYDEFVPQQGKRIITTIDRQGVRIRENIKERSPKGKEIVKGYVMKGVHIGLTPARILAGTEGKQSKRRRR